MPPPAKRTTLEGMKIDNLKTLTLQEHICGLRAAAIHWDLRVPEWLTTKPKT